VDANLMRITLIESYQNLDRHCNEFVIDSAVYNVMPELNTSSRNNKKELNITTLVLSLLVMWILQQVNEIK
jgi:hypothetical protein